MRCIEYLSFWKKVNDQLPHVCYLIYITCKYEINTMQSIQLQGSVSVGTDGV